jgi:hypothetical protein
MAEDGYREIKRGPLGETFYVVWKDNEEVFDRDDGPAVTYAEGSFFYYRYDQIYRVDGPCCGIAVISNGKPIGFTFQYRPSLEFKDYIPEEEFAKWYLITFLKEYEWLEEKRLGWLSGSLQEEAKRYMQR